MNALTKAAAIDGAVVEMDGGSVVAHAHTGSFECVRLAPHFAPDDRPEVMKRAKEIWLQRSQEVQQRLLFGRG
jgi:hypothetical protein